MAKDKKNKKKVTYIDDGRTIADMSTLGGKPKKKAERSTLKDQWNTYWQTVKMMFVPMLIVLGILAVAFLIMYVILP